MCRHGPLYSTGYDAHTSTAEFSAAHTIWRLSSWGCVWPLCTVCLMTSDVHQFFAVGTLRLDDASPHSHCIQVFGPTLTLCCTMFKERSFALSCVLLHFSWVCGCETTLLCGWRRLSSPSPSWAEQSMPDVCWSSAKGKRELLRGGYQWHPRPRLACALSRTPQPPRSCCILAYAVYATICAASLW